VPVHDLGGALGLVVAVVVDGHGLQLAHLLGRKMDAGTDRG
jgi:hypothetical protein